MKVCFENLSTNTDNEYEVKQKLHPLTVFPDKPETNIAVFEEVVHYEPKDDPKMQSEDSLTIPEKKPQSGRKPPGAPRKIGALLKNFYPKLKRLIKQHSTLEPSFSICFKNRIKMLEFYGDLLQPFLIELSQYNRLATRPTTENAREKENQKILEKDKAIQLLDEYDKLCKKR